MFVRFWFLCASYWTFFFLIFQPCLEWTRIIYFTHIGGSSNFHLSSKQVRDSVKFSSVTQLCPTLCDPMNCSTPGLPVHHQLPEFTQTHVHRVGMPSSHLILCRPLLLLPPMPPSIRVLSMSQLFAWGGQSTGVSALASFLQMNTQGWSPLEWTGWISLQSKGLSRVFSNTTVQKHQSSALSFLHSPTLTSIHDYWKTHSLD